jgi:hypothetical protein
MSKSRNRWLFYDKIVAPRIGRRARLVKTSNRHHLMIEEGLCQA